MSLLQYSYYIDHLISIYGLPVSTRRDKFKILYKPTYKEVDLIINGHNTSKAFIAIYPDIEFVDRLSISATTSTAFSRADSKYDNSIIKYGSYFPVKKYANAYNLMYGKHFNVKYNESWFWIVHKDKQILIIGTDFVEDQIRLRQGDPGAALNRPDELYWGIAGERPNYLYRSKLYNQNECDRPADELMMRLVSELSVQAGLNLSPLLPNGAKGAIVITGDDDQADLAKYNEQLEILGDLPITYFLHPKTKHSRSTLRALQNMNHRIDYGIHPDALDEPTRYSEIFDEQVAWFKDLTGYTPLSVRNHGFLNDGYWGHLNSWLRHEVAISSNLPGFDGNVMNGSLLPVRMFWKGLVSNHWSILTAIGDGVRFAGGMSREESRKCIKSLADKVISSGMPGVIVLNLHPQNVSETVEMHKAVHELVNDGFVPWNVKECLGWFQRKEKVTFTDRVREFLHL